MSAGDEPITVVIPGWARPGFEDWLKRNRLMMALLPMDGIESDDPQYMVFPSDELYGELMDVAKEMGDRDDPRGHRDPDGG